MTRCPYCGSPFRPDPLDVTPRDPQPAADGSSVWLTIGALLIVAIVAAVAAYAASVPVR